MGEEATSSGTAVCAPAALPASPSCTMPIPPASTGALSISTAGLSVHRLPSAPICFPEMGLKKSLCSKRKPLKSFLCLLVAFQGHQTFITIDF